MAQPRRAAPNNLRKRPTSFRLDEKEWPPGASRWSPCAKGGRNRTALTPALSLREWEHPIPHRDESRRCRLSKAQRTVLPLLGERAGVKGKTRSAIQRACELPMKSTARSKGKQSSTPGKATSP